MNEVEGEHERLTLYTGKSYSSIDHSVTGT